MSSRSKIAWGVGAGLVVILLVGVFAVNARFYGIPAFEAWRAVSSDFHGGQRADINGISLYYETYGRGPPLLVMHGAVASLETMHPFIRAFAHDRLVVAPDSRAHYRSTDAPGPLTYEQMGADMIALLDSLHIETVDVIGWSDGGIIGLDMAMKHPERVRRLIAIGANVSPDGIAPETFSSARMAEIGAQAKVLYDRLAPDPSHFPVVLEKIATMIHTEPHYSPAELARITARTLIVAGENDIVLRPHTDLIARSIPGAEELIVPGAPHEGPLTMPDTYVQIARDFLSRD